MKPLTPSRALSLWRPYGEAFLVVLSHLRAAMHRSDEAMRPALLARGVVLPEAPPAPETPSPWAFEGSLTKLCGRLSPSHWAVAVDVLQRLQDRVTGVAAQLAPGLPVGPARTALETVVLSAPVILWAGYNHQSRESHTLQLGAEVLEMEARVRAALAVEVGA